ncbi:uncharacterized protein L199_000551 [Kwoniella botswanensis]|uniref:uncharacterized protein n=1 Tax=Kwoniella botswanensis TaxID=1268659 RepID=UPI00315C7944
MSLAQYRPDISQAFQSKVDKWIISNCSLSDDMRSLGSIVVNENKRKIIKHPETGKWFQYGRRAGKKSYLSDTSLDIPPRNNIFRRADATSQNTSMSCPRLSAWGSNSERATPSIRQRYFATPTLSTNVPSRYQSTASTASEDIPNGPFLSFALNQDQGKVRLRIREEVGEESSAYIVENDHDLSREVDIHPSDVSPTTAWSTCSKWYETSKSYISSFFPSLTSSATEGRSCVSSAIEGGGSLYPTGNSLASQASEGFSSAVRSGKNRLANGLESFARSLNSPGSEK